jgi:asparagine synthetase B (glutamine-hydrolysing)
MRATGSVRIITRSASAFPRSMNSNSLVPARDRFEQKHTTVETTPGEIASLFPAVVDAMDEPMADPACFPLFVLCKEIRRHATVVLSGEGSDELFRRLSPV